VIHRLEWNHRILIFYLSKKRKNFKNFQLYLGFWAVARASSCHDTTQNRSDWRTWIYHATYEAIVSKVPETGDSLNLSQQIFPKGDTQSRSSIRTDFTLQPDVNSRTVNIERHPNKNQAIYKKRG